MTVSREQIRVGESDERGHRREIEPMWDTDHYHGLLFLQIKAEDWERIFGKSGSKPPVG